MLQTIDENDIIEDFTIIVIPQVEIETASETNYETCPWNWEQINSNNYREMHTQNFQNAGSIVIAIIIIFAFVGLIIYLVGIYVGLIILAIALFAIFSFIVVCVCKSSSIISEDSIEPACDDLNNMVPVATIVVPRISIAI